jgi:hypothetical protein
MDRHVCSLAPVVHSYRHKREGYLYGSNFVIYIIKMVILMKAAYLPKFTPVLHFKI